MILREEGSSGDIKIVRHGHIYLIVAILSITLGVSLGLVMVDKSIEDFVIASMMVVATGVYAFWTITINDGIDSASRYDTYRYDNYEIG
jgi:uncharacterized membrane protein